MIIPHDKALHYIYGTLVALATLAAVTAAGLQFAPFWALGASAVVGALKEVYDKCSGKGNPETADFYWTALGGVVVAMAGVL